MRESGKNDESASIQIKKLLLWYNEVECIDNREVEKLLTVGKTYAVIKSQEFGCLIRTDSKNVEWFSWGFFKR